MTVVMQQKKTIMSRCHLLLHQQRLHWQQKELIPNQMVEKEKYK